MFVADRFRELTSFQCAWADLLDKIGSSRISVGEMEAEIGV